MELFRICFEHSQGRFHDLHLDFCPTSPPPRESLLGLMKKDFSVLESAVQTIYEPTGFEKTAKNTHTHDRVNVGFEYSPTATAREAKIIFASLSYQIDESGKRRGTLDLNLHDQEERILRIYDAVLAIPELTVDEQVKPIQQRIALLREGKRGEELLQALGYR